MKTPAFFDAAPRLLLQDALAEALGAAAGGFIEYAYADVVKLAGHSCPTVAGAFLMTRAALARLYPGATPSRGGLRVDVRQPLDEGVAGVVGSVAGMITGAAGEGGFKGLGGRFSRQGLLRHGVPMAGELRFTRLDTGASVEVAYHPEAVERPRELKALLVRATEPGADAEARATFAAAWQDWVRRILVEHADDPALVAFVSPAA